LLCVVAICSSTTLTTQQVNRTLHEFWEAAMDGDAARYHSFFSSNLVVFTNGEEDDAPWKQESFIKGLFSKVRYREMKMNTPVGLEASTGTFICHFKWSITIMVTGQEIDMGTWSTRFNFDSAGKIARMTNIGLNGPLIALATALTTKKDSRETTQNFVNAMNAGNVPNVQKLLNSNFFYFSNGEEIENWEQNLPNLFNNVRWYIKILDYATAGPGEALVNVECTVQAGGNSVTSLQGWHMMFNTTAPETILSIVAIQDSLAAHETALLIRQQRGKPM